MNKVDIIVINFSEEILKKCVESVISSELCYKGYYNYS